MSRRGAPLGAFLLTVALLTSRVVLALDGKLKVVFLDVGQADAILITCPDGNHHLLIDTGDTRYPGSGQHFRDAMQNAFPTEKHLTTVVASHPHQDHIGNMEWLLKNFAVDHYVDNGQKTDTASFGRLEKLRKNLSTAGKLDYINGKESSGEEVPFCSDSKVKLRLLEPWASDSKLSDTNDRSVAVRLDYKDESFLFVGDIEGKAEDDMLNAVPQAERALLDVNVLKVGHHGSDTSSSAAFLNAITPQVAVISCGKKGIGTNVGYKHPRASTVRRFVDLLKPNPLTGLIDAFDADKGKWVRVQRRQGLWDTDADKTVTITTDGQTLSVEHD